jgi:hypothetical protein
MATSEVTRLASATARDGVDTRNKENSVTAAAGSGETTRSGAGDRGHDGSDAAGGVEKTTMERLTEDHAMYLKKFGVRLPGAKSQHGMALCCLFENLNCAVSIETIREYIVTRGGQPKGGDSVQVRHLAMQYGWNMLKGDQNTPDGKKVPKSHFMLLDTKTPHPGFIAEVRSSTLTADEWTAIKTRYGNKCVNCGSADGEPMRWDEYSTTVLQKGHMDPRKALTADNVIPQCRCCNQQYKDKAVFNERGYVIQMLL